ncbi:hypothetical protein MBLNU457_1359t1 [Dothideomycetes sp. NU457]
MVRLKHRYLLVNILYPDSASNSKSSTSKLLPDTVHFNSPSPDALTPQLLLRLIRDNLSDLFGDYGSGMYFTEILFFVVKYLSPATSTAIVRVTRAHYRLVWAALTYTTRLPGPIDVACVFRVVRVSGTIRKSEEEAIRRAKASILRASRAALGGEGKSRDDLLKRILGGEDERAGRGIEDDDLDGNEEEDVDMD